MTRALAGLSVLDLATFMAAPFCCTLLGEFGADVIKVEQPGIGDDLRRLGRPAGTGVSYMWLGESRNKKSITCNLRAPEGQALIITFDPDVVPVSRLVRMAEEALLGYLGHDEKPPAGKGRG